MGFSKQKLFSPPALLTPAPPPDKLEADIAEGRIAPTAKLTDVLPFLKTCAVANWYDAIMASDAGKAFAAENPILTMRLFNASTYTIEAANENIAACVPACAAHVDTQDEITRESRALQFGTLAQLYNSTETAHTAQPTTAQAADGDEIARKSRSDKGGKHTTHKKRISEWRKTARAVADDFNKSRFVPERGAKPMGGCTETQIKQWDLEYPDAEHPHPRWGYYADLRLRADLKNEYGEVLQNWARYWADYKIAFKE